MSESHKAQVQAQFGASAHDYVTSAGHAGGADLEQLVAWGRKRGAPRVLDVATGGGHTALAFSAFTPTVISTDLTPSMLEAARGFIQSKAAATGNVRFLASDVEALPFRDSSYGVVTCRLAAHHFPAILPALKEVARVLRPGGSLLVEDILGHDDRELAAFILEVEKRRDPSHVRALTHREWEAFLKAAGMTVIDEEHPEQVAAVGGMDGAHADDARGQGRSRALRARTLRRAAGRPSASPWRTAASRPSRTVSS